MSKDTPLLGSPSSTHDVDSPALVPLMHETCHASPTRCNASWSRKRGGMHTSYLQHEVTSGCSGTPWLTCLTYPPGPPTLAAPTRSPVGGRPSCRCVPSDSLCSSPSASPCYRSPPRRRRGGRCPRLVCSCSVPRPLRRIGKS